MIKTQLGFPVFYFHLALVHISKLKRKQHEAECDPILQEIREWTHLPGQVPPGKASVLAGDEHAAEGVRDPGQEHAFIATSIFDGGESIFRTPLKPILLNDPLITHTPRLFQEESSGHAKALGKTAAKIAAWNGNRVTMKPSVTLEERLAHLNITKSWDV